MFATGHEIYGIGIRQPSNNIIHARTAVAALPNEAGCRVEPVKHSGFTVQYYRFAFDNSAHEFQTTLWTTFFQFYSDVGTGSIVISCSALFRHLWFKHEQSVYRWRDSIHIETRILFNCLLGCKRSNIITFAIIDIKLSRTALARVNETRYQIQLVE